MTDTTTTATKVADIIAEHLGVDRAKVTPDAKLIDDLGADSLDCVEVTMALEDDMGVSIDDDDANRCSTVQDWTDLVVKLLA